MKKALLLCAASVCAFPATAMAQSTGTTDFEGGPAIVVTGSRQRDVAGVQVPDTSRARAALGSEFIQRQTPGQTINDVINQLPGVSFQNNDPYGSGGGTLTIRGFDSTRISQTFDGVPLNDSGNYALYSNQQLDPELIEQVNISLGSTDVDSPTAAATGSTVNYRTRLPTEDFHVRLQGSLGEYDFFRVFGVVDTGVFTPWGTRAFVSASSSSNDNVFNNRGVIDKEQYNARIYQPLGDNGDFISIAGHYNKNRNNFFGSVPLRTDTAGGRVVPNRFPITDDERFYTIARCEINTVARPGIADAANSCGSTFDERFNPSNTGNIRLASRFTLAEGLVLSVDPSIQFVSANGGGTVVGQEGFRDVNPAGGTATPAACVANPTAVNSSCQTGYIGGTPYFGRDLNGDGDRIDTVRLSAPSQTRTRRIGVIASLRYEINDDHNVRIAYSYDRARHRQTGEVGLLQINGEPFNYFPINNPLADVNGNILQKRDRLSYAILHQIGGEYRGEFMDDRLTITAGLRAPFFTRDLNNFCATSSATGFVECFGTNTAGAAAYAQFNGTVTVSPGPPAVTGPLQGAQQRVLKYDEILPSLGFVFDVTPEVSVFANGSRGLQVPGTDNLYNSFFFAPDTEQAQPRPERTDNFDLGMRYRARGFLAQTSVWYTRFEDRLASSYDPELERTVYRNLGTVEKYGIDASVAYQVVPQLQLYAYGSYLWSEIQDNVQIGGNESVNCDTATVTNANCAVTAGRRESGAPVYTFGGRVQGQLGPVEIGIQAKRTGPRYVNDVNLPIVLAGAEVYGAKAPAYTLVDADVRIPLNIIGANDRTWLQFNVTNLFDVRYVGGFGGNLLNNTTPNVQIGSPRAFSGTLVVGF
jgi:iron complex outermembrane receptor protein